MKHLRTLLLLLNVCIPAAYASDIQPKVLMVLSSYGLEQGEKQPGYEFDEFSKAYLTFTSNGVSVDIASPTGGKVEADKYDPEKPYNARVLNTPETMAKLNDTLPLSEVTATHYQSVFVVGGKGAMFDLPYDKTLQRLIADIYENEGTVSAVCHGPAALVNVQLSDGSLLVANKRVNGFTNQEEKVFGKKWVKHFDFLLEDKLTERGANFEQAPIMMEYVAVDHKLITGQNPFSTVATAEAVLRSMGITPKVQPKDQEALTIELIAKLLKNDKNAEKAYLAAAEKYQTPLIGMYGYYTFKHASNEQELGKSVDLMELAANNMQHPMLQLAIAQGQKKLGETAEAKATLIALIANNPDMQEAKDLLAQMQ